MERKRTTAEKIGLVVTVCLWIGAFSFLIWFTVTEVRKAGDMDIVITSAQPTRPLRFPGIMICPPTEAVLAAPKGIEAITVSAFLATINSNPPFQTSEVTYTVCPRVRTVESPNVTVQCVDYEPNPVASPTPLPVDCSTTTTRAQYYVSSGGGSVQPWNAVDDLSSLMLLLNSTGWAYRPMVAMFYSDNTLDKPPADGDFNGYAGAFSMMHAYRALIDLSGSSLMTVKKYITDNYPDDNTCNYDYYDYRTQPFYSQDNPDITEMTTLFVGYDSLYTTTECHRPVLSMSDVIGIWGGGVALVLACTILIVKLFEWCLLKTTASTSNPTNYERMNV